MSCNRAFQTPQSCPSCYISLWWGSSRCKFLPAQMYCLSSSPHCKLYFDLIDALSLRVAGQRFLFSFEGVNDNRPQTMADAWPSQMWKTAVNSRVPSSYWLQKRRSDISNSLDGWFSVIRSPLSCEMTFGHLNDELRNKILWLESLYRNLSRAPSRNTVSLQQQAFCHI